MHINHNTKKQQEIIKAKGDLKKLKAKEHELSERDADDVLKAGQDDTRKARKEIERIESRDQKEAQKIKDDQLNALDMKKQFQSSYKRQLAQTLTDLLSQLDWLSGWEADVVITNGGPITIYGKPFQSKKGILLVVKTAKGNVMHKGMYITFEPALDYAGLYTICLQVENTMDKARGLLLDGGQASGILDSHGKPVSGSNPL